METTKTPPAKTDMQPKVRAFKIVNGEAVETAPPTKEQLRSASEQLTKLFTPDGHFRKMIEMREEAEASEIFKTAPLKPT